jgi:glutamine synthetase adenylyltransferase
MPSSEHSGTSQIAKFDTGVFRDPDAARQNFDRVSAKLSSALKHALPSLLAETPDPDSAVLLFDRFISESSPEILRLLEAHPFLAHYAIAVFGHSWYLGETLIRNPDLLHGFLREKKLDRSLSREEFSEARQVPFGLFSAMDRCSWQFKRREYVHYVAGRTRIAPRRNCCRNFCS